MIVNNIQPCPKLCLLMQLARVGARTDSTIHVYRYTREAWPISAHAHWSSTHDMRRGFSTLVLLVCIFACSLDFHTPQLWNAVLVQKLPVLNHSKKHVGITVLLHVEWQKCGRRKTDTHFFLFLVPPHTLTNQVL